MNVRLIATLCAAGALAVAAAAPADAAKTIKKSYTLSLPVPYPVDTTVPTGYGCNQGPEGATKNTTAVTFPANGSVLITVEYTGDWDLYLLDASGAMVGLAETAETGNTGPSSEKINYKKIKKGAKYSILACNWLGLKDATVTYTFTYGK